jgi:hypothetical protein
LESGRLLINFSFAIAVLFGSGRFACGGIDRFLYMFNAGVPKLVSIRFGGIVGPLGWWMVKKESRLWAVPSISFIVFIEFDFEVDLHENNNNSIYNLYVLDDKVKKYCLIWKQSLQFLNI